MIRNGSVAEDQSEVVFRLFGKALVDAWKSGGALGVACSPALHIRASYRICKMPNEKGGPIV